MRLLEFVPCGGLRGVLLNDDDGDGVTTAAPRRHTEETAPLPCAASSGETRRKRTRGSGAWRPSLGAISEDGKVAKTAARPKQVEAAGRSHVRSEREELSHFSMPAFAPTAFLF